jgi:hypothetical protein
MLLTSFSVPTDAGENLSLFGKKNYAQDNHYHNPKTGDYRRRSALRCVV